jgi:hypothetical protein
MNDARTSNSIAIILVVIGLARIAAADTVEWKKTKDDDYKLMSDGKELAELVPDANQGNVGITSPSSKKFCGVNWPHFLMLGQGWLTDKVESEGFKLIEFKTIQTSGPAVSYSGKWQFRDCFTSSEIHFAWYDTQNQTQVHLIKTQAKILKDLPDIGCSWVEFMTPENSYTTVAARIKGGKVITMDISGSGKDANMHYWDGNELADDGWITIYGARKGQDGCVAMVPLTHGADPLRPRINNGHVDNIEIHVLDARKHNLLKKGRTFRLQYLLIAGPDQKDWKWIDAAVQRARAFMTENADLMKTLEDNRD